MDGEQQTSQQESSTEVLTRLSAEEHSPLLILSVQLLAALMLGTVAALVYQAIAVAVGWESNLIYTGLHADASAAQRWQMRAFLALSHLMTFVLAGWIVVRLFYPPARRSLGYLRAHREPPARAVWGGVWLMLLSVPLVLYVYQLNRALPIPEALRQAEEQANEMLKALLRMDDGWELLANLGLIALLPAVGEELVFRGVVQQQIERLVRSPWLAIVLAGTVFSVAHFQFEGFLPRLLLGILLGWLYWRFQNFWVPVAAHFANNAVQVVAQYLYHEEVSSLNLEDDITVPLSLAALSAVLTLGLAWWLPQRKTIF